MNQDSAELTLTEQPVDTGGKEDTRGKNSANCRTRMPVVEAHWNAICHEVRCDTTIAQKGWRLRLATLSAYMRHQTHKHGEGPGHLYNSEDRGRPALGNQGRKTSSVAHSKHKYATGVDEFVFTH